MIDTPSVDWLALSPTLALLGASGVALLSALLPAWMRKGVAGAAAMVGFVLAAVLAGYVFDDSPTPEVLLDGSMVRDQLAALAQVLVGVTGAAVVLVSWRERRRTRQRVPRASRDGGRGNGVLRRSIEPDDAVPGPRMVLALPLRPRRHRHDAGHLARGGSQVPDRRRLRLGGAALRLRARVRRDL